VIRRLMSVRIRLTAFCFVGAWAAMAATAVAQVYVGHDIPRGGNVEISGGVAWAAGNDLGSISAEETRNTGTGTGPFVLFDADSKLKAAAGVQAHIGVYVSSAVSLEGGVLGARPHVTTQLSGDAESAPDLTADETLTRLIIDGSVLFHFTGASFGGGRGVPFVFGGGGYLRDAHEKNEVIDTGHEYHAGAGLHYWTGQGKHRVGIRAEGGLSWRTGGADFSGTTRAVPTITASIAYLF
jgi:hypothetical protein